MAARSRLVGTISRLSQTVNNVAGGYIQPNLGSVALVEAVGVKAIQPARIEPAGMPLDLLKRGLQGPRVAVEPTVAGQSVAGMIGAGLAGLLGGESDATQCRVPFCHQV